MRGRHTGGWFLPAPTKTSFRASALADPGMTSLDQRIQYPSMSALGSDDPVELALLGRAVGRAVVRLDDCRVGRTGGVLQGPHRLLSFRRRGQRLYGLVERGLWLALGYE